jgi:hypothetical protein
MKKDPDAAIEAFRRAALLNRQDPLLHGAMLEFPTSGQLVMTGDLHGHMRNFERLVKFCDLERYAVRHLILHELVHAEPESFSAPDMSIRLSVKAAEFKCRFPDQVHFLQSNHELAQLTGHEITKGGRCVLADFARGATADYGSDTVGNVLAALNDFIASFPYAAKTKNGIFIAHSLPNAREMDLFDPTFFEREPSPDDFLDDSDLYRLVWGRDHTPELLDRLGLAFNCEYFIVGHQPQDTGWFVLHNRLLIIASDHNHGVFLPIDLNKTVDMDLLVERIRPLASIA